MSVYLSTFSFSSIIEPIWIILRGTVLEPVNSPFLILPSSHLATNAIVSFVTVLSSFDFCLRLGFFLSAESFCFIISYSKTQGALPLVCVAIYFSWRVCVPRRVLEDNFQAIFKPRKECLAALILFRGRRCRITDFLIFLKIQKIFNFFHFDWCTSQKNLCKCTVRANMPQDILKYRTFEYDRIQG